MTLPTVKRTLLFGAGQGAENYLYSSDDECQYIGIIDNDANKHGTVLFGLKVYSVAQLPTLDFDNIVVVTQWSLEVKKQLVEELGIAEELVIIPSKTRLKKLKSEPFRHAATLALGRKIITSLCQLFFDNKVNGVIDFGTLLGITRDKDIIAWDDDIDFAVSMDDADKVMSIVNSFKESEFEGLSWSVTTLSSGNNTPHSILLKFEDPRSGAQDAGLIPFITSISFRENKDGKSLHLPSLGMWYAPEEHFLSFEVLSWRDCPIQVPFNYKAYLAFIYGDWEKPKQNMTLEDYANIQSVSFDDFQSAGLHSK